MNPPSVPENDSLESLVAQVADDFRERQKRGEQPDPEEYAARYPQHAAAIVEVLAALHIVHPSVPPESSASGQPNPPSVNENDDTLAPRTPSTAGSTSDPVGPALGPGSLFAGYVIV